MEQRWRWRIGVGAAAVLVAGAVIGGAIAAASSDDHVVPMPSASVAAADASVVVDVQGAVEQPGVYVLANGARVLDAIARAGGATDDADTSGLNLAQPLVDGAQIIVPVEGEAPPVEAQSDLVNVNTADAATLETLPRVGPTLAAAIIAFREEHGPFTQIADLEQVPGIGPAVLAQLEPLVTV